MLLGTNIVVMEELMNESNERVQFISDYIISYENKIKILNKEGLFDAAKLFELFAIKVCSLYFKQEFFNLNVNTFQYPCVDLISEDKNLFVQVSTVQDVPTKIKNTLESIRDSKHENIKDIKNVIFFLLSNDSINNVVDYKGENKIGNFEFIKKENLITTRDVIYKAEVDLDFQLGLYDILKKEEESVKTNLKSFKEALRDSATCISSIEDKINGEYSIDLSEYINNIREHNHKNILIEGKAGSGKTVLCKKLVEQEEIVLFARAERFCEETNINSIWHFNLDETLEYLNNKKIVIFIDALEFIADNRTKLDMLMMLYERTKDYRNVFIIVSCRTSDKSAFIKLQNEYSIVNYEVANLNPEMLKPLADKYSIIRDMQNNDLYSELLGSPFYLNIIISNMSTLQNISDENQLREYIWQKVISLNDSNIRDAVNKIVFERAKNFLVGVPCDEIDPEILKKLESNNIVTCNDKRVRLKYDIFEDICFEQYIDKVFYECKGDYKIFFDKLENMGRCIYRRYQIWIENKLLAKNNRDKFIYSLLFSKTLPDEWHKQTEIGLVKSRHSESFFIENANTLIKENLLLEFVNITNLYGFELDVPFSRDIYLTLKNAGIGRKCLINIIAENNLYKTWTEPVQPLEKLVIDYSQNKDYDESTAINTTKILAYLIDEILLNKPKEKYWRVFDCIKDKLRAVYKLGNYCKDWINNFFNKVIDMFKGQDDDKVRFAEDVIENIISYENCILSKYIPNEVCNIFELYYTFKRKPSKNNFYIPENENKIYSLYGLNKNAESYDHESFRKAPQNSNFVYMYFCFNGLHGLKWMVQFINKLVLNFKNNNKGLPEFTVYFAETNKEKKYFGYSDMWLTMVQEHQVPTLIADIVYSFKELIRFYMKNNDLSVTQKLKIANNIKNYIYENSNNIILLSIISEVGMEFEQLLPGYAIDLISNMDIVINDLTRYSLQMPNPLRNKLENEIMISAGLPFGLKHRYKAVNNNISLREYARNCQIEHGKNIRKKTFDIIDYLYRTIPDDLENCERYLQLQQIDMRKAEVHKINDSTIESITGMAKQKSDKQEKLNSKYIPLVNKCNDLNNKIKDNTIILDDYISSINLLLSYKDDPLYFSIENNLFAYISLALNDPNLDIVKREEYCKLWIENSSKLTFNGSMLDSELFTILFKQINLEINGILKNDIKQILLDLILYEGPNGKIRQIAVYAKQYLRNNIQIATSIFYTILALAKDEMNHQKYNAKYIIENKLEDNFVFKPNMQAKLVGVDQFIENDGKKLYCSNAQQIIKKYLYDEQQLDLDDFNLYDYDIHLLSYALNCGVTLDGSIFDDIVRQYIEFLIHFWHENKGNYSNHEIIGVYELYEVQEFIQREILSNLNQTKKVLSLMFDNIDYSLFEKETVEFYLEVFGCLLSYYFDSYDNAQKRQNCEEIIELLAEKINAINDVNLRINLTKCLMFCLTRYGGSGDWSNCKASYSYKDKLFLNKVFANYGYYHLGELLEVIYKMHLDELLPEILLSLKESFEKAPRERKYEWDTESLYKIILDKSFIIDSIINKSFFKFARDIKEDNDLIAAFEYILNVLVEYGNEKAAVILDEFRIH